MRLVIAVFLLFVLSACGNTFYIVRHAEKAKPLAGMSVIDANDPPLSDSGNLRALALKDLLKSEGIRYIFSTNYKRTINTAKPLDEYLLGAQTELYNPKKDSTDAFIQKLKLIKKGNVLVVGHSNTIDDIANKLCGAIVVPADLKETDYDNLYKIKRKGNKYTFKGLTYGVTTE
ncbi:MAG: phosphoglycerate mutase family protein [Bacteroidota bacterium]|nr:phosphoglycerate mutase family protein [Bacteroidota bacterium]